MANWIAGAVKNKGALHRRLGIKGKIPVSTLHKAAAKGGTVGKEANLALTLRGFHHGGYKGASKYKR